MSTCDKNYNPNMREVTIEKDRLIGILKENKRKHDHLYDCSVSGYWETAKKTIYEKQSNLTRALENKRLEISKLYNDGLAYANKKVELKPIYPDVKLAGDLSVSLPFPISHSDDYQKAIRMLELSIYDQVTLSSTEFDQFVLNNWAWKIDFLTSTVTYLGISGCSANTGYFKNF